MDLEGPLYVQPFLYDTEKGEGLVIANYNAFPVRVKVKSENIKINGLDIK